MARSLIAFVLAALGAVYAIGCAPHGRLVLTPEPKSEILHVTTAYAYEPEKVKQGPFDKRAARESLAKIDVTRCGSTIDGHAKVTFAVDGSVSKVDVDYPSDLPGPARECVRAELSKARVLAFDGSPITLGTSWRASR